jgi:hypothetical protein
METWWRITKMRLDVLLLSALVIVSLVAPGIAEGACSRKCSDGVEWLGMGDLGMDLDMPDPTSNHAQNTVNANAAEEEREEASDEKEPEPAPNVTGGWHLELSVDASVQNGAFMIGSKTGTSADSPTKSVDLVLAQSGETVTGRGNLTMENDVASVEASGSFLDGQLSLNLVPVEGSESYDLILMLVDGVLQGRYDAHDAEGGVWSGTAEGTRLG